MVAKETNLWQDADQSHKKLLRGCREFETLRRKLLTEQKQENVGFATSLEYKEGAPMIETNSDDQNTNGEEEKELDKVETAMTSKKKTVTAPFETTGLSYSTAMSQMTILPDDVGVSSSILPPGMSDINGHQIDLRTSNSCLLKMDQVSTPEIMECTYINAIAPFVLNSRLQPLMTSPAGDD